MHPPRDACDSKLSIWLSVIFATLLLALGIFGRSYRPLLCLFLPLGLWFSLKHEPEQRKARPAIRVLGWIFVGIAAVAFIAPVIAIAAGR